MDNIIVMLADNFSSITITIGRGFFAGVLIGYALKKAIRIVALVVGLFIGGLAFLQYQQIASINWNKLEGIITTLTKATTSSTINICTSVVA